jgi:hypothetical protein
VYHPRMGLQRIVSHRDFSHGREVAAGHTIGPASAGHEPPKSPVFDGLGL